jgi:hydrogenase maturation protease
MILVLGVGNILFQDEGLGPALAQKIAESYQHFPNLQVLDAGTLSFSLAPLLREAESVIMLDAADLGQAPGSIQVFYDSEVEGFLRLGKSKSVHEVTLLDILAMAQLTEDLPPRRALLAMQPACLDWGDSVSPLIASAFPAALTAFSHILMHWYGQDYSDSSCSSCR